MTDELCLSRFKDTVIYLAPDERAVEICRGIINYAWKTDVTQRLHTYRRFNPEAEGGGRGRGE